MAESKVPNLRKLRTDRLLSQSQLSAALGISSRTLLRWEAGDGEPGASDLLVLARFFKVSIDQLVSDLLPTDETGVLPKVSDLSGRQLDYWIAKARGLPAQMTDEGPVIYEPGFGQRPVANYCTDWAQGGPVIENNNVHISPVAIGGKFDGVPLTKPGWIARSDSQSRAAWGSTALEAAMRAYLIAEIGEQILA